MSAAHCFDAFNLARDIVARVGDHDLTTIVDTIFSVDINIASIKIHEQYDSQNSINDIAILATASDIIYTRGVGPACLPWLYSTNFINTQALQAVGWGSDRFGGPLSKTLRQVTLNIISNSMCTNVFSNLADSQLCTFYPGRDSCQVFLQ